MMGEAISKKDKTSSAIITDSEVMSPQNILHIADQSTEVVENYNCVSLKDDDLKAKVLPLHVNKNRSELLPSWFKSLFGSRDNFLQDTESETLELFMVHKTPRIFTKLPFGHQRLTFGLKQLTKKNKKALQWAQYMSLDFKSLEAIESVIVRVKKLDSRQRTCLAFDFLKKEPGVDDERMLIFFSVGAPIEPVQLTDCVGRKFSFPFERCRTWKVGF